MDDVEPEHRRDWTRTAGTVGVFSLRGPLDAAVVGRLQDEAAEAEHSLAVRHVTSDWSLVDGCLTSPRRHSYADAGPLLREVHEDVALSWTLGRIVGGVVRPSRAACIYYSTGDFVGIHTDRPACDLALLLRLSGEDLPLEFLFRPVTGDLVDGLQRSGPTPPGGTPIPVPDDRFVGFAGRELPHWRAASRAPVTIAALCYERLF